MTPTQSEKREAFLLAFTVVLLAVSVIWIRTATVKDTYQYVQQEKELRRLKELIQADRLRWLTLTSPKRLETLAKALGLSSPRADQRIKIEAGAKRRG